MSKDYSKAAAGTFALNKKEALHSWYSYLEGYSSCLIDDIVTEIGPENIHAIYDPFCGTGTTALVASSHGIPSYYCETNPFMQMVIDAKINSVKKLRDSGVGSIHLQTFLEHIKNFNFRIHPEEAKWDGFEKFFDPEVLFLLQDLKLEIDGIPDIDSKNIALVLLASVTVRASKMIRQGDLRFAKDKEKKPEDKDLLNNFIKKLEIAIADIDSDECPTFANAMLLDADSRNITITDKIDCVITSPPYLNGTNYIRNTKLELKLSGFCRSEKELPAFHSKGIIAGINNVSKRKNDFTILDVVKPYLDELEPVAYDKRIPLMVAGYFYDMNSVIEKTASAMVNNGYFIMDIGDSQFAGVHIPTHEILTRICESHGFVLYQEDILRERRSKNGMVLSQRLLKFRLQKATNNDTFSEDKDFFRKEAEQFILDMPYKQAPYSGRNWGHAWHSLCSYHGKLKPAIAHFLVEQFTNPGDVVVDPLSGVGTIPLEACLQGRIGVGNDLSELAYTVTKAKVEKATKEDCLCVLETLKSHILKSKNSASTIELAHKYADFGFNGKLPAYFHEDTFLEILAAREYFISRIKELSAAEAMVFSCFLHVLHGNRPYALSRNSHPLTPYAPTGDFVYKNVIDHISDKLIASYKKGEFELYRTGRAIYGDCANLGNAISGVDAIISSPPFADSIRFYMQNWMRLWLCGWELEDFKTAEDRFLDQKQKANFDVYNSFFRMCSEILKPHGKVILHLGKTATIDMAEELSKRAEPYFIEVFRGSEDVQTVEKHGIKDKGATVEHQYLFLMKK